MPVNKNVAKICNAMARRIAAIDGVGRELAGLADMLGRGQWLF
jgi:hypothetical protein